MIDAVNLNVTDTEYKQSQEEYNNLYRTDRARLDEARTVISKLGLGGLWRGYYTSVLTVYHYKHDVPTQTNNTTKGHNNIQPRLWGD